MPKLDNSITEELNVKVTRSRSRAGSVDLDLERSSQRTPLKSNILETISETGSVDSDTTQEKSLLTKENLARLNKMNEAIETPPSASKRITRRASITSEDISAILKTSATKPFIKLARTKMPTYSEEETVNVPNRGRGRPPLADTIKTSSKIESNLNSPHYNTRRNVSITSSITIESPTSAKKTQKITESTSSPSNTKLDKTQIGNLRAQALQIQTSTPNISNSNVEPNESTVIEIIESSGDSEINDSSDDERFLEYYRNTGLKKFTGTIQNKSVEEEPLISEPKLVEEITVLKGDNDSDDQTSNKEYVVLQKGQTKIPENDSKLSLKNTSNFEKHDLEVIERTGLENTIRLKLNASETLENKSGNADSNDGVTKESQPGNNQKIEYDEKESNLEYTSEVISDKLILLETPTEELVNTLGSSTKVTPKRITLITSVEEVTPAKLDTLSTPITPFPTKLETPAKQETSLKLATPVKQGTPKSTTPLVEKLHIPKMPDAISNMSQDSESIIESNNSSQPIETNCNNSKVLFIQNDDVLGKQYVYETEPSKLNINEGVSISSAIDDVENADDNSSDLNITDTFEIFTKDLFRTKAKSCSPKVSKKILLQSQSISSSFHDVLKFDKECDELNKSSNSVSNLSKSASGMFTVEDDNVPNQSGINIQDTSKTNKLNRFTYVIRAAAPNNPDNELFVEEDNNDETVSVIQNEVSNVEISSSKKHKQLSSPIVETVMPSNSFVETKSAKKQKLQSSIVDAIIIPLNTTVTTESFIEVGNQEADGPSEELKITGFVTHRKNKQGYKLLVNESDDQPAGSSNTSIGAFVETDNDLNLSSSSYDNNKKLNRSKTIKSKMKSPKVVVLEKREFSKEEIETACNKILQERELARNMLREQFGKKKNKKKKHKPNDTNEDADDSPIRSIDTTPKAVVVSKEIEVSSPKSKMHLEYDVKQKSANSSQTKMDVSVDSNYSDSSKGKKLKKRQNQKTSPIMLNQRDEQKEISQSTEAIQFRGKKRKFKSPSFNEESTMPELLSPKRKKFKKQSQKTSPIKPKPVKNFALEIPSTSNHRLPDSLLNQLEVDMEISQPAQAVETCGKKRKLKLPPFNEKEKTPELRPSGFKVSPITPKILSNNFRVSIMPTAKLPKKKLFKELINVLPQSVWTTAGLFEESDVGQENKKNIVYSTTNFMVEDVGDNLNRTHTKKVKNRKTDLNEFKKKNLFRTIAPRSDAKHVLKSMRFEQGNIKFLSK